MRKVSLFNFDNSNDPYACTISNFKPQGKNLNADIKIIKIIPGQGPQKIK
jgi:hypothetical protein